MGLEVKILKVGGVQPKEGSGSPPITLVCNLLRLPLSVHRLKDRIASVY